MFKFKGISSEDMQVIIEEEEHFIARASQRYETIEIEGRDGAIFNELGYSVVERPIYVQCLNINKIDDILAWLNGEGEFEYKGRKTTARFYSQLEPQRSSCIRIIDTTFIRDPFWYKANEEYILSKDRKDKTVEGESIDLTDSAEMRFSEFYVRGNSKQDGEPTPNTPIEVESCGDNVNLFDKDTVTTGRYVDYLKGTFTAKEGYCTSDYIEINSDNITISGTNEQLAFYDENKTYISGLSTAKITSIPTNAKYMIISLKATEIDNVKVEKGKVATPYSKYGQGCINEVICNKNYLKLNDIEKTTVNGLTYSCKNGKLNLNGTLTNAVLIDTESIGIPKGTYCFRTYVEGTHSGSCARYIRTSNSGNITNAGTLNVLENDEGFFRFYANTGCVFNNVIVTVQLEEGTTATNYISHQSQAFSIPTQQPMRSIGNVRDTFIKKNNKRYERHNITRLILDGTESWEISTDTKFFFVANIISGIDYSTVYCNIGLTASSYAELIDGTNRVTVRNNGNGIYISNPNGMTLADWKAWLQAQYEAGTPVYVDYVLATPIDIECTEEQSEILWDIEQNAKTYKNITHMYSTDNVSPNIEVTYFTPTNETINNEGNIQSRPILRLEKTVSEAVELTINDIRFKYNFKDDEYVEIDCEEKTVEYEGLNRNRQITIGYDYPKLNIGSNKITMHDGDCIIKILRKDRWL